MISKEKIKEINSRRKSAPGFTDEDFARASKNVRAKIIRNKALASTNIASIYNRTHYVTSSFDGNTYQQKSTSANLKFNY